MLLTLNNHKHGGRGMIVSAFSFPDKPASEQSSSPETIAQLADGIVGFVKQSIHDGSSFDAVEQGLFQRVLHLGGVAMDLFLKAQGDGDLGETVRTVEGVDLQRSPTVLKQEVRSVFKEHAFESFVYSRRAKQKIELRPIDARLGLPKRKESFLFQEFSQLFCIEKAFAVGARQFERIFGQKISVAELENINRDMGEQADRFLNENLAKPKAKDEGELLVLTADAKGVPLVKSDAKRVPVFDAKERPGNRRMATLGCAYTVDRFRRTPENIVAALFRDTTTPLPDDRPEACGKHYRGYFAYQPPGEEPIPGAIRTWTWLADEAAKRHRLNQPIVRLMDGQPILWESAEACLDDFLQERRKVGQSVRVVDILDILHVSSYVWKAAKVFHAHKEHQEAFARKRLLRILQGETAGVVKGLRRMASLNGLNESDLETVTTVCNYFENNASRMRYDEYLVAGYPIATGVIEGACRHVIKDRMEQGGMRWTLTGADAMLNVRAVNASSESEAFQAWRRTEGIERQHPHRHLAEGYSLSLKI
jgi:hypothetical protein